VEIFNVTASGIQLAKLLTIQSGPHAARGAGGVVVLRTKPPCTSFLWKKWDYVSAQAYISPRLPNRLKRVCVYIYIHTHILLDAENLQSAWVADSGSFRGGRVSKHPRLYANS
jgi:hypothetical protein